MLFASADCLHFADFRLERARQQLWSGSTRIELRPKTWELLLHLLTRAGEVVTVDELLEALWPAQDVTPKALTNRIVELRRALGEDAEHPRVIQTLHRRGYRLIAAVSTAPQAAVLPQAPTSPPDPAGGAPLRLAGGAARCFVGRERELSLLDVHAQGALQGRRQLVLVLGEAGLGKSALIDAFLGSAPMPGGLLGCAVCLEQSGELEPFDPWLSLLADLAAGPGGAQVQLLLRRCAPSWLVQMPWLMQGDEALRLRHSLQGTGAGRMLREACAFLEVLSQLTPLLLVLEDLHWSDAASIDLLAHLAQGRGAARLMVLASARAVEAEARGHPFAGASRRLIAQGQARALPAAPLSQAQVAACVAQRFGAALAACAPLLCLLHRHAEGHPLYLGATLDHLVERGWLAWRQDHWALTVEAERLDPGLPEPIRHSIQARLALLDDEALSLLRAASVLGMQWPEPLLQAALQWPAERVQRACDALLHGPRLLRALPAEAWPGSGDVQVFRFAHDVYRRVLYDGMGLAERQALHRRVACAMETAWQGRLPEVAGTLALHCERSAQPAAAARLLEMAAGVAAQRYAYREAAAAIEAALHQLKGVPAAEERERTELRLQLTLANLRGVTRGHARADQHASYLRAYEIAARLGEARDELRGCMGLCITSVLAGRPEPAMRWGRRLVELAEDRLPTLRSVAHCYAGLAELAGGTVPGALACFDRSLGLQAEPGIPALLDTHALAGTQRAWALALSCRPAQARAQLEASLAHGRRVCSRLDLMQNLYWLASTHLLLGEASQAMPLYAEVQALADEQDAQTYRRLARVALLAAAPAADGGESLEQAVREHLAEGEDCYGLPLQLLLVQARLAQGDAPGAAAALACAAQLQAECAVFAGELLCLQAAVLAGPHPSTLSAAQDATVRCAYLAAIDKNLERGTLAFALRAATALLNHALARGDGEPEAERLTALLDRIGRGTDMPDTRAARAALALRQPA
jgi:DNA-binding winged helix-turn-helix (wHTH) protein